ncbi:MAG: ABC transporter ATP-binding protein [Hyphomicrobiales bacterium]|nr:ABC transporter ATP-binding protein [Hyphomicrobiales bacterium]
MKPVIEAEGVSRSFGEVRALDGVTLSVPKGVIFGLLGPSGSGKTTFIRIVAGGLTPDRGRLRVLGRAMPDRAVAAHIGYMTQTAALYPDLSLRENLEFFGELYGLSDQRLRERIEEIGHEVELSDRLDSPLHTFSGGMRQRASLACALLHEPELLILDEPTVGLDPVLRRGFWSRFRQLADSGRTLLVSSHIMDEAERCDLLAFVRDGRILASDTPDALRRRTGQGDLEDAFLMLAGAMPDEPEAARQ